MDVVEILTFLGFSTVVGGTISFFIQRFVKKRDEEREKKEAKKQAEYEKEQKELKEQQAELERQNKATQLGVQALLRDRLLQGFRKYIQMGYAGYDDRKNMENMYQNYEALGPNSVMEDLYNQFTKLPERLKEERA